MPLPADTPSSLAPAPSLAGKVAWVTGASRGLGRALAEAFAAAGADLLLTARDGTSLDALAAELEPHGRAVEVVPGSVADAADVQRAADRAAERWGRLDVLVNNAGISPAFVPFEQLDAQTWREVLDVNVEGVAHCCRSALPLLEAAGDASVVNVSSIYGTVSHTRIAAYAASKGAIELLTRTLALEWAARGIRVNAMAPGYVETDMTAGLREHDRWREHLLERIPLGRFATPQEIAATIVFLASPAASYMTGTTLTADGGWTAQ